MITHNGMSPLLYNPTICGQEQVGLKAGMVRKGEWGGGGGRKGERGGGGGGGSVVNGGGTCQHKHARLPR